MIEINRLVAGVPWFGPIGVFAWFAMAVAAEIVHGSRVQLRWVEDGKFASRLFNMCGAWAMAGFTTHAVFRGLNGEGIGEFQRSSGMALETLHDL